MSDPEERGWHVREYGAEIAGTMFMVLIGLSAVALNFGAGSPTATLIPNEPARRLLTGVTFAGAAPSWPTRRSGCEAVVISTPP